MTPVAHLHFRRNRAAVKLAVLDRGDEGVGIPGLPIDRDDVGMARENDAALLEVSIAGGKGREQVCFAPIVVESQLRIDAVAGKVVADPIDQRHVRLATGRIERDQRLDELHGSELGPDDR